MQTHASNFRKKDHRFFPAPNPPNHKRGATQEHYDSAFRHERHDRFVTISDLKLWQQQTTLFRRFIPFGQIILENLEGDLRGGLIGGKGNQSAGWAKRVLTRVCRAGWLGEEGYTSGAVQVSGALSSLNDRMISCLLACRFLVSLALWPHMRIVKTRLRAAAYLRRHIGALCWLPGREAELRRKTLWKNFAERIESSESSESSEQRLGRNLLRQQKCTEAEPLLREALQLEAEGNEGRGSPRLLRYLAMALLGQGKVAEAESLLESDVWAFHQAQVWALIDRGEWSRADALWQGTLLELTRAAIPPRPQGLDDHYIDLSAFFNGGFDRNWHFDPNILNDLSLLPTGLQELAGVAFDIRGLIQLGRRAEGLRGNEHLGLFPSQVTGIPMGLECRQLHFLHSAVFAMDPKGTRIGTYRLNFEDGERVELPIVLGEELLEWHKPPRPVETEGSLTVAWEGVNGSGITVRLFKTGWQNPRPEVRILSLDFVGHETQGAPFLVAITAK